MFSMVTVASSTRIPTASAMPPMVMMLSVSPKTASKAIAPMIDNAGDGGRQDFEDVGRHVFHALHDRQRGGGAGLQDVHQHRALTIDVHNVDLRRVAVAHIGNVAYEDRFVAGRFNRQCVEFVERARGIVQPEGMLIAPDLDVTGRVDLCLCAQGQSINKSEMFLTKGG